MSLSTSTECSVQLPAVVRISGAEAILNREGCGPHMPTAALGQHSRSTAVGQTNCAKSQFRWAYLWSSVIFKAWVRDPAFGGEMVWTEGGGGFSFQNSGHQKVVDFTDGDYFFSFNLSFPHEICIICFHLCLLLGFHKRHTQNVSCPSQPIGAGGLDSICGHLALWLPTQIELEGRIFNTACNSSRSDLQTERGCQNQTMVFITISILKILNKKLCCCIGLKTSVQSCWCLLVFSLCIAKEVERFADHTGGDGATAWKHETLWGEKISNIFASVFDLFSSCCVLVCWDL